MGGASNLQTYLKYSTLHVCCFQRRGRWGGRRTTLLRSRRTWLLRVLPPRRMVINYVPCTVLRKRRGYVMPSSFYFLYLPFPSSVFICFCSTVAIWWDYKRRRTCSRPGRSYLTRQSSSVCERVLRRRDASSSSFPLVTVPAPPSLTGRPFVRPSVSCFYR